MMLYKPSWAHWYIHVGLRISCPWKLQWADGSTLLSWSYHLHTSHRCLEHSFKDTYCSLRVFSWTFIAFEVKVPTDIFCHFSELVPVRHLRLVVEECEMDVRYKHAIITVSIIVFLILLFNITNIFYFRLHCTIGWPFRTNCMIWHHFFLSQVFLGLESSQNTFCFSALWAQGHLW